MPLRNIGQIREQTDLPVDERAREESRMFISENNRSNREKNTKHWAFVLIFWAGVLAFVFVLFAQVWHLVCPDNRAWLNEKRLGNLSQFLTHSFIGGAVVALFKSKIGNTPEQ